MIANGKQDTQVGLYNYALGGVEGALGSVIIMHEAGPGGTEAVITRNAEKKKTNYEIKLPKESMGLDALELGTMFGIGMAINDGDEATPGQKGWGGLGAHALVFGKAPQQTALVTLGIGFTGDLRPGTARFEITEVSFDPAGDLTIVWNSLPNRNYAIDLSPDMVAWQELDDGLASAGLVTQTVLDAATVNVSDRLYFRIRLVE
jgi:hypothetical protein